MENIMFKKILVLLMLAIIARPAFAYFYNGNDLHESLKEYRKAERSDRDTDYSEAWKFRGFVTGVYDATEEDYCTPKDFTTHQLMAIVAKYIESNPQLWSNSAEHLVKDSLKLAFPCKE